MNIAEFSIKKSVITWVFAAVLLIAGINSFNSLSRLEDPEFTIKQAIITTPYPGATAAEVEEEVSNVIEKAVQELGQLWYVESSSFRGKSVVRATIKDRYASADLPQIWDELRRKVNDYQRQLPPGAGPSVVNDDYGDVFGVFFAITGEGYSYRELWNTVDFLKRELLLAQDVKKITIVGDQQEVIYVEIKREKMAQLGVTQQEIYNALSDKNIVVPSGYLEVGSEYLPLMPTGEFTSEKQFGDLLISKSGSEKLIYLKDVAEINRDYIDPPSSILRVEGKRAIGIGVSTAQGGNVVTMGRALKEKMKQLFPQIPLGMEIRPLYIQSDMVTQSINAFMVNLIEAVVIVVVVLLFFMGLQSGLIIGVILILTICGTFIFMSLQEIILQRISLGALIIALGMLVDNAIVIVEGMKVKIESGGDALEAAKDIVGQTAVPLLGATVVAILAFAAIGVSQDSTGEFCGSLFQVILISLLMSWVTAVTITPLLCKIFIKPKKQIGNTPNDPYAGKMFVVYKGWLQACIKYRRLTILVVVGLFLLSLVGFRFVRSSFFPSSTTPKFLVNVFLPEGTNIKDTENLLKKSEDYLMSLEGVKSVALTVGGGFPRFILTYSSDGSGSSYGQFLITVDDYRKIDTLILEIEEKLLKLYPDAIVGGKKIMLGPGEGGKIQFRIIGPDADTLRALATKAKEVLHTDGEIKSIRDEWREKIKVIRPELSEAQARRSGITRQQLAQALEAGYSGKKTGVYREKDYLIPIVARAPLSERKNIEDINNMLIFSPAAGQMIPMGQVVSGFRTEFQDNKLDRINRKRAIKIHADPKEGLASELLARVKPKIEKALNVDVGKAIGKTFKKGEDPFKNFTDKTIPIVFLGEIPIKDMPGYYLNWAGEAADSSKANANLSKQLPIFGSMMVVVVILLFNAFLQPLIIWLCVPLAIIGVTIGLLTLNGAFGFMALLGLLSLSGMLIKNAIVLVDQIDVERRSGKDLYWAIVDSGVSRMRPVLMAAATTILGMLPLLSDAFFVDMAITIMSGLFFATGITLILVPVLYSIFFKVPNENT